MPSSDRSQRAVIERRRSATMSVDRTRAVDASVGRAAGAISGPPAKWKTPSSSIVTRISSALPSLSKLRARYPPPAASDSPMTSIARTDGNRQKHHPSTRRNPHPHPPSRRRAPRHGPATRRTTAPTRRSPGSERFGDRSRAQIPGSSGPFRASRGRGRQEPRTRIDHGKQGGKPALAAREPDRPPPTHSPRPLPDHTRRGGRAMALRGRSRRGEDALGRPVQALSAPRLQTSARPTAPPRPRRQTTDRDHQHDSPGPRRPPRRREALEQGGPTTTT
jgi:hypothetical protein